MKYNAVSILRYNKFVCVILRSLCVITKIAKMCEGHSIDPNPLMQSILLSLVTTGACLSTLTAEGLGCIHRIRKEAVSLGYYSARGRFV